MSEDEIELKCQLCQSTINVVLLDPGPFKGPMMNCQECLDSLVNDLNTNKAADGFYQPDLIKDSE